MQLKARAAFDLKASQRGTRNTNKYAGQILNSGTLPNTVSPTTATTGVVAKENNALLIQGRENQGMSSPPFHAGLVARSMAKALLVSPEHGDGNSEGDAYLQGGAHSSLEDVRMNPTKRDYPNNMDVGRTLKQTMGKAGAAGEDEDEDDEDEDEI